MQDSHDVIRSMACLSVAGREPGFEKTNQDYVVVHPGPEGGGDEREPFVFGVLDGHGVEGLFDRPQILSTAKCTFLSPTHSLSPQSRIFIERAGHAGTNPAARLNL